MIGSFLFDVDGSNSIAKAVLNEDWRWSIEVEFKAEEALKNPNPPSKQRLAELEEELNVHFGPNWSTTAFDYPAHPGAAKLVAAAKDFKAKTCEYNHDWQKQIPPKSFLTPLDPIKEGETLEPGALTHADGELLTGLSDQPEPDAQADSQQDPQPQSDSANTDPARDEAIGPDPEPQIHPDFQRDPQPGPDAQPQSDSANADPVIDGSLTFERDDDEPEEELRE